MDADAFVDAVREANRTALSRLGSSKALYALTEGEMEPDPVRTAAATLADGSADVLESWDGDVYADAAAAAADHREAVDGDVSDDTFAVTAALAEAEGPAERRGAFVGWTLVAENVTGQCTGFFTGQADPQTASTFRGYGSTLEDLRERALANEDDLDEESAERMATDVVQAAYEEYVETLEGMGVNPKPVC